LEGKEEEEGVGATGGIHRGRQAACGVTQEKTTRLHALVGGRGRHGGVTKKEHAHTAKGSANEHIHTKNGGRRPCSLNIHTSKGK
jgi:succinyl-CoA synthetase beta subunit